MESVNRRYGEALDVGPQMTRRLPLTLIGYWKGDLQPEWPRASDFVDEHWDSAERELVASYLDQGLVARAYAGWSDCRLCGAMNGSAEWTDGVYLWPEGLAHYVREHRLRPPVSVIRHIVRAQASMQLPPTEDEDWWQTFENHDGWYHPDAVAIAGLPGASTFAPPEWYMEPPPGWWEARVNEDWWKTATLDS